MTLPEMFAADPLIVVYVTVAAAVSAMVLAQLLQLTWIHGRSLVRRWRTRRLIRAWNRADARARERRRREAVGDTLVDELRTQYDGLRPFVRRR